MSIAEQILKFQMWLGDVNYKNWAFRVTNKEEAIFL